MGAHWLTDLPDVVERRRAASSGCGNGWETRARSLGRL